ncbi:unnamed protein product [Heligmosomoides polygyrus]|uniref:Asp_Arg_Hydrox domain-containing protein n=1 Tax=Heligmosomoides polygyrus TaxID=6339 RepID=A0A3P7XWJ0_HELPZ|nr:unnamed protein product [Heligmosomoides polygyrus]
MTLFQILENDHNNGIALAYYGYILKVAEDNVEQGVAYMKKGLRLGGHEITDAKFYYHLGHGLMYLGRSTEAVERQWVSIRAEAARILQTSPNLWKEENPTITVDGRWIAFPLLENVIPQFQMRFSALSSGAQILPHCGPTNSRLQAHLGLIVPSEARISESDPKEHILRVGNEQRGWKTGKFIIFDDSFEHEVSVLQFDGASSASLRLILLIDLWHPEVESRQRITPEDD